MVKDIEGSWRAEHRDTHSEVVAYKAHEPHEGCTGNLIVVKVTGNRDTRKAIAELIAAAPDLLEAMRDAMRWFAKLDDWSGVGDPDLDKYREAIAKAEGKEAKDV